MPLLCLMIKNAWNFYAKKFSRLWRKHPSIVYQRMLLKKKIMYKYNFNKNTDRPNDAI